MCSAILASRSKKSNRLCKTWTCELFRERLWRWWWSWWWWWWLWWWWWKWTSLCWWWWWCVCTQIPLTSPLQQKRCSQQMLLTAPWPRSPNLINPFQFILSFIIFITFSIFSLSFYMLASLALMLEESNHNWLFSQDWDSSLIKFQARENLINFFPNLTNWPTMPRLLLLSSANWDPYVFEQEEIRAFLGQSER